MGAPYITPGDWTADERHVSIAINCGKKHIATVNCGLPREELVGNANAISAVGDMRAALLPLSAIYRLLLREDTIPREVLVSTKLLEQAHDAVQVMLNGRWIGED